MQILSQIRSLVIFILIQAKQLSIIQRSKRQVIQFFLYSEEDADHTVHHHHLLKATDHEGITFIIWSRRKNKKIKKSSRKRSYSSSSSSSSESSFSRSSSGEKQNNRRDKSKEDVEKWVNSNDYLIQRMIECPWLNLWAQLTFEWTLLKFD